jgi:two-component system chemotaxis response regulator CheY
VRTHERFRSLPVVVLTTRSDEESRAAAMHEGATRYLTKPFQPATLAPEIRALLGAA